MCDSYCCCYVSMPNNAGTVCNCNCFFIYQVFLSRACKGTFRSSSQAAYLSTTYVVGFTLFHFIAGRQAVKLQIPIFIVFDLTRSGIEPESTVSVADAPSTLFHRFGCGCRCSGHWSVVITLTLQCDRCNRSRWW